MRIRIKIQNLVLFLDQHKSLTLLSLFMVLGISVLIPWHMDEFGMLHRLACWQTAQQVNVYRESCFDYPISILGIEYFRAYQYAGITSSILAAPFYYIFKSIWMNYVIGFLFLIGILVGIQKSFGLPKRIILIGLIFFPLTFTVLHDAGPVRVSLLTLAWSPYFILKFLNANRLRSTAWLVTLSGLWILSTEDKPYFLYLIPGIVLLVISAIINSEGIEFLKNNFNKLLFGLIILSTSALLILVLLRVNEVSYLSYLRSMSPSVTTDLIQSSIQTQNLENSLQNVLFKKLSFIAIWAYFPHRVIELDSFQFNNLLIPFPGLETINEKIASSFYLISTIGVIVLYLIVIRQIYKERFTENRLRNVLLIAAMATLWLIPTFAGGWTSHHYVFFQLSFFVLLILLFEEQVRAKNRRNLVIILSSTFALLANWFSPINIKASPEIEIVYKKAIDQADSNSIINCASWGCYFQYSLLNKDDIPVVFVTHPDDFEELENYAESSKNIVFTMCSECDIESVSKSFPDSQVRQVSTETKFWKLFKSTSVN